jgi:hypothetical protein
MEFYSKSRPNLILPEFKKSVYKLVKKNSTNSTISEKISNMMYEFYKSYIESNRVMVTVIILVVIFLLYRYYNKEDQQNKKEQFTPEEYKILDQIQSSQTAHLRYDKQPSFNPLYPVNPQHEKVYYPPDPLPINIPKSGIVYARNLYEDPSNFENLNPPNYDYNSVYDNSSRSYYNGTYNTYKNAQDTNIINPYGYLNNFNTSTGDFIGQSTYANQKNLVDYQSILDNVNGNLNDALKIGPHHLNTDYPELTMEPPYSVE